MKTKKILTLLLSLVLSLSTVIYSALADTKLTVPTDNKNYAMTNMYITSGEESIIRKQFAEDGVSPTDIEILIEKIKCGELLDSEKQELLDQIPEDYFVFEATEKKSIREKIYRFKDGSYVKVKSIPTIGVGRSIDSSNYGVFYNNEYIETTYGSATRMGFYATFSIYIIALKVHI